MPITTRLLISDPTAISQAHAIIRQGGLIAFPTDTIYGVAADSFNPEALERLYAAKDRPEEKALPVLIGSLDQLDNLVAIVSHQTRRIATHFWPGALTLVLPKAPTLPPELSPYPTVGIRMPNLAFTLNLLRETGPLATTSANLSGGPNPTSADDVLAQLDGRIDLVLDGGNTSGPQASTVVDASSPTLKILREGPIQLADLQALLAREER